MKNYWRKVNDIFESILPNFNQLFTKKWLNNHTISTKSPKKLTAAKGYNFYPPMFIGIENF